MRIVLAVSLLVLGCGAGGGVRAASSVCTIEGGAPANSAFILTVGFGFSGCASPDARCTATVDGGIISLTTSATVCSTGNNPGGVLVSAPCTVPALAPGTYSIAPFTRTQTVTPDAGPRAVRHHDETSACDGADARGLRCEA